MARAEPAELGPRLASALVLGPATLLCVWLGGAWFAALVVAAAALMGWEWARLIVPGQAAAVVLVVLAAALPSAAMAAGESALAVAFVLLGALAVLVAARRASPAAPGSLWAAAGTACIALPCVAALWLERRAGAPLVLWLFVTVWATDSGAYAVGRSLGGPRLAPHLSPNKTWAGFAGGIAAAAAASWAVAWLAGAAAAALVPAGIALSLAAHGGDLLESLAKRRLGVKDAGSLIPGHGGLLDRLDGMLAATAMAWALTCAAGADPLLWRG